MPDTVTLEIHKGGGSDVQLGTSFTRVKWGGGVFIVLFQFVDIFNGPPKPEAYWGGRS